MKKILLSVVFLFGAVLMASETKGVANDGAFASGVSTSVSAFSAEDMSFAFGEDSKDAKFALLSNVEMSETQGAGWIGAAWGALKGALSYSLRIIEDNKKFSLKAFLANAAARGYYRRLNDTVLSFGISHKRASVSFYTSGTPSVF